MNKQRRFTMSQGIYLGEGPVRRPQATGNPLLRKIQRSCRLSLPEPDLALNLDVADYINDKQGACPRDAVIAIVKLINSRDTHTAIFALSLLDVLVKNCGYPLHLQISRKEFLNELVKRFPEHPPLRYSKVQKLILTAIEEWYQTLCKHASYKDDLGYIRDMHRLLKYKGYIFPKINESDLAVLRPNDQLKTPSEIQKEQEVAQAAKLEELIRRGKPEDLREANKLMKVMAGFKQDNVNDAKQSILSELNKLKRKADLLNDMLSSAEEVDIQNDTIVSLFSSLKSAQPKFLKIIQEEQEDESLVQDLLQFNDTVNQLLEKFDLFKIGNKEAASHINPSSISSATTSTGAAGGALANEINLIDFDDETDSQDPSTSSTGNQNGLQGESVTDLLSDLNELSISSNSNMPNFGAGGSISLGAAEPAVPVTTTPTNYSNTNDVDLLGGFSAPSTSGTAPQAKSNSFDLLGDFSSPSPISSTTQRTLVNRSDNLKIEFEIHRESDSTLKVKTFFSNTSANAISNLNFLLAVPKTMTLRLQPQTGSFVGSFAQDAVSQESWIDNAMVNVGKALKIKWKATYSFEGKPVEETAVFTFPEV